MDFVKRPTPIPSSGYRLNFLQCFINAHQGHPVLITLNCFFLTGTFTLFGPGHGFLYISANARTSALKNLTLPNYKFEKGMYAFNPVKFSRIVEKNEVRRICQNFISGDPYKRCQTPLRPTKSFRRFFWRVLVIQTS